MKIKDIEEVPKKTWRCVWSNFRSGLKNYKTTIAGIAIAVLTLLERYVMPGAPELEPKDFFLPIMIAVALFFARDATRSTEDSR